MSKNLSPTVTLTREQKEQRRFAAAEELLEGEKSQAQIAEDHGVSRAAVTQWKQTLEEDGIEGLESTTDEGNQGPDPQLDEQDREQLVELLEKGAQAHGWETDLWTSKRVATLIERQFDIEYTPRHCSRILRELGYRPVNPKKPRKKIPKRSAAGSPKRAKSSKKAERRRNDPVYRGVAVPV
jgi:transposase